MVLKCYFDDSSDNKRQQFMAVGGVVGSDEQFTDLDIMWSSATRRLTKPFHASDCECQQGEYSSWLKSDCDSLIKDLTRIVYKTNLGIFGSIVPVPEYRLLFPFAAEYDPYFLSLAHTIVNMAYIGSPQNTGAPGISSDVRIWVEDGPTSARALTLYQNLKNLKSWKWASHLSGFATANKKLMAMQAADLTAREAYKHVLNLGTRKTRKPVKALRDRVGFQLFTKEVMERLRDDAWPENLEALTTWADGSTSEPQLVQFYGTSIDMSE